MIAGGWWLWDKDGRADVAKVGSHLIGTAEWPTPQILNGGCVAWRTALAVLAVIETFDFTPLISSRVMPITRIVLYLILNSRIRCFDIYIEV